MEDDNSILIEDDILKAISFNGGISGTTDVTVWYGESLWQESLKERKIQNLNWGTGNTWIMLAEIFGGSNKVIKCECSRNYSTD